MGTHARMSWFPRAATIAACLCAGAAITVGVAWWIATRGTLHEFTGQYTRDATAADLPPALRSGWPPVAQARFMPGSQPGYEVVGVDAACAGSPGDREGMRVCTLWSARFGWPMLALGRFELSRFGGSDGLAAAEALYDEAFPTGAALVVPVHLRKYVTSGSTFLPARIILPGFLVNTLAYAGGVWVLAHLPGFVRRCRWIARGRCGACGYEIGALARCPECGRARSRRGVARPAPLVR